MLPVYTAQACTHSSEREEAFTSIALEIRNQHKLEESLEQYVKGEMLEGANAYKVSRKYHLQSNLTAVSAMTATRSGRVLSARVSRLYQSVSCFI